MDIFTYIYNCGAGEDDKLYYGERNQTFYQKTIIPI